MRSFRRPGFSLSLLLRDRSLLLLLAVLSVGQAYGQASGSSQVDALLAVKSALGGAIASTWNASSSPCTPQPWPGLGCMGETVTSLSLRLSGAQGSIPDALFDLTGLTLLDLGYNKQLTGSIPEAITRLSGLRQLALGNCSVGSSLPEGVTQLLSLNYLSVRENFMAGPLPTGLGALQQLTWLDITYNRFSGPLPESLTGVRSLQHLHLGGNLLSDLPQNISVLSNLVHLLIDNNRVVQPLPPGLLAMQNISIIQLSNNSFSLENNSLLAGQAPNLLNFVASNAFNMPAQLPIPPISGLPKLEILDLSGNTYFYGSLPSTLSTLPKLITLNLANNSLSGPVPDFFTRMSTLQMLDLSNNLIDGYLEDFSSMPFLTLNLQGNNISDMALGNLNPSTGQRQLALHLYGNPLCRGCNLPECLPANCTQMWYNVTNQDFISNDCSDVAPRCDEKTALSTSGGVFLPSPAEWAASSPPSCVCASPLRANISLNSTSFADFTPERMAAVQQKTVAAMNTKLGPTGFHIDPAQVIVSQVVKNCSPEFVMTLDFYPPASGEPLDTQSIQYFLTKSPGYLDQQEFGVQYVKNFVPQAEEPPSSGGLSAGEIAGIVVGSVVGAALLAGAVAFVVYKQTKRRFGPRDKWSKEDEDILNALVPQGATHRFKLEDLRRATNNFDGANKLGEGGYGEVYRGEIAGEDGQMVVVAVKRAKEIVLQGGVEFRNEIELLSRVRHRNLVELKGFCRAAGEQLLVYEFIGGGTLSEWIYPKPPKHPLSWDQRMHIALGAATGLAYLHYGIQTPIIHRDIKPGNILIDDNFNTKVADFGLSKAVVEESHDIGLPTQVKGTPGFLDPEYYLTDLLTEKSDVYSFGVVMLQLATGMHIFGGRSHIRDKICQQVTAQGIMGVVDPTLRTEGRHPPEASVFEAFVRLGMKCCTRRATARPTMEEVEALLTELHSAGAVKKKPGLDWNTIFGGGDESKAGDSSHRGDSTFAVDDDEELVLPPSKLPGPRYSSSGPSSSGQSFSEQSGAFVGPDGELYENSQGQQSGVVAK